MREAAWLYVYMYGPIYACISSGYQNLFHVREGYGDKATKTQLFGNHVHAQFKSRNQTQYTHAILRWDIMYNYSYVLSSVCVVIC